MLHIESITSNAVKVLVSKRHVSLLDAHKTGYIELLTIATQLLAIYCANISASERAFSTSEAESKRESRNAGAVGGDVS
jgi:hypothetical protein